MALEYITPELIALVIAVIGAVVGIRYYKAKFSQMVKLLVRIDEAWSDDKFSDPEIKDIINLALDFAGKEPASKKPGD